MTQENTNVEMCGEGKVVAKACDYSLVGTEGQPTKLFYHLHTCENTDCKKAGLYYLSKL
jgi:hypothetical protein